MGANDNRELNVIQLVQKIEPDFNKLAAIHGAVNFQKESAFALQILQTNSYLMSIAVGDQDSLKRAILNVAIIGLSLSPVHKLAYLVPRDKKICLDISYRGLIQLALDVGAIKWAKAELVYKNDVFKILGTNKEPLHEFEPFGDRGEPVGAYSLAKSHDGDFFFDFMTADQIVNIRNRSESWKAHVKDGKTTPWDTDFEEMVKKTMLKRASKSWPMRDTRDGNRFNEAIDVTNDIDFNAPPVTAIAQPSPNIRDAKFATIRGLLTELGREESAFVLHLNRTFRRDFKELEDLTDQEISEALVQLNQFLTLKKTSDAKKAELAKKDVKSETA